MLDLDEVPIAGQSQDSNHKEQSVSNSRRENNEERVNPKENFPLDKKPDKTKKKKKVIMVRQEDLSGTNGGTGSVFVALHREKKTQEEQLLEALSRSPSEVNLHQQLSKVENVFSALHRPVETPVDHVFNALHRTSSPGKGSRERPPLKVQVGSQQGLASKGSLSDSKKTKERRGDLPSPVKPPPPESASSLSRPGGKHGPEPWAQSTVQGQEKIPGRNNRRDPTSRGKELPLQESSRKKDAVVVIVPEVVAVDLVDEVTPLRAFNSNRFSWDDIWHRMALRWSRGNGRRELLNPTAPGPLLPSSRPEMENGGGMRGEWESAAPRSDYVDVPLSNAQHKTTSSVHPFQDGRGPSNGGLGNLDYCSSVSVAVPGQSMYGGNGNRTQIKDASSPNALDPSLEHSQTVFTMAQSLSRSVCGTLTWRQGGSEEPPKPTQFSTTCRRMTCIIILLLLLGSIATTILLTSTLKSSSASGGKRTKVAGAPPPPPRYSSPPSPGVPLQDICSGMCCSSNPPIIGKGEPVMTSAWWSSQLDDGSQVQILSVVNQRWLGSKNNTWPGVLAPSSKSAPDVSNFMVAVRTASGLVQFAANNGLFLAVQPDGTLAATASEPSNITSFNVTQLDKVQVQFQSLNGQFWTVAVDAKGRSVIRLAPFKKNAVSQVFKIREVMSVPAMRGVNLGGWLILEDWISPELFGNLPALMDGAVFTLQSVVTGNYMNDDSSGVLKCTSPTSNLASKIHVQRPTGPDGAFQLRLPTGQFLSAVDGGGGMILANVPYPGSKETFQLVMSPTNHARVLLKVADGQFVQPDANGTLMATGTASAADLADGNSALWRGPLAYTLNITSQLRGEWQLSSYLGSKAPTIISTYRSSFISESDFKYMKKEGLNAVRVPIGYWLTQGPNPDPPFVAGGLQELDQAFYFAELYGIRMFLSMHGAKGSQNGFEHSASRDGIPEFATPANIDSTLAAIEFLAGRYASSPVFLGIGLLNEPSGAAVPQSTLEDYYTRGYAIVRTYSQCAYIGLGLYVDADNSFLDKFMTTPDYNNVIIDTHLYNVFNNEIFGGQSADYNIQYVRQAVPPILDQLQQGSRQAIVGEWSQALLVPTTSSEDYGKFGAAQLDTYGTYAAAGWFFWNFKVDRPDYDNWSFEACLRHKWLQKTSLGWW